MIDIFVFQRIQFLTRPQLKPHQLRPEDDPADLAKDARDVDANGPFTTSYKLPREAFDVSAI